MIMRLLLPLILIMPMCLCAQNTELDAFGASITDAGVYLRWTISVGDVCDGTDIERAGADSTWHRIGRIDGVCGSLTEPVDYDFLDEAPIVGQTVSYRLVLGAIGTSTRVSINYENFSENGFSGNYQPQAQQYRLSSEQVITKPHSYKVYDMRGTILLQGVHMNSESLIPLHELEVGTYIFVLYGEGRVLFSNRFLKLD